MYKLYSHIYSWMYSIYHLRMLFLVLLCVINRVVNVLFIYCIRRLLFLFSCSFFVFINQVHADLPRFTHNNYSNIDFSSNWQKWAHAFVTHEYHTISNPKQIHIFSYKKEWKRKLNFLLLLFVVTRRVSGVVVRQYMNKHVKMQIM